MSDTYAEVKEHFGTISDVMVNEGRGAQGMKYGSKMFVMFFKGGILAILPPDRVTRFIAEGIGHSHDPGTGRVMTDRLHVTAEQTNLWLEICEESLEYFKSR